MTAKEKVLAVYSNAFELSPGKGIFHRLDNNRLVWLGETWQNAAESLPAQPEQVNLCAHGYDVGCFVCNSNPVAPVEANEEVLWIGSRDWVRREEEKRMNEASQKLRELVLPIEKCRHCGHPLSPLGNCSNCEEPAEAKEKEQCPNCNHKAHFALRCGAVIAAGSGGEYDGAIRCECLNWDNPVAEPKPTPSTSAPIEAFCPKCRISITNTTAGVHECPACHGPVVKPQPDSSSIPEIELELRRMMWLGHGHTGMYGDDGEMQCMECRPFGVVDYKREPLDKVRETFRAVQMERMMKPRDSSSISTERHKSVTELAYQPENLADYLRQVETELRDLKALHARIIEQGRLVQIGASGDGPVRAMSAGEYIEWVKEQLEGK